jgi:hypothetical protein
MIWQLHHQFKDYTVFVSQKELPDPHKFSDADSWLRETQEHHPLPKGAVWLMCNEMAKEFSISNPVTKEKTEEGTKNA